MCEESKYGEILTRDDDGTVCLIYDEKAVVITAPPEQNVYVYSLVTGSNLKKKEDKPFTIKPENCTIHNWGLATRACIFCGQDRKKYEAERGGRMG
jgi:hypothetical protein